MDGADNPARDVVVVTTIVTLGLALYEIVTANVATRRIIIFLLLAGTQSLHPSIRPENCNDLCFPNDERVKELGDRVFSDCYYGLFVKVIKTRGKDSSCCAHFVLLGVGGVLHLAIARLEDKLKVRINNKRCFKTILVLIEFDLRMFRAWSKEHMEH